MEITMYKKIDLVNACLRAIGNEQVVTLDLSDTDTDIAIVTVNEAIIDVLSQGWWFNTELNWKLAPDSKGHINLPDTVIDFRTARCSRQVKLVKRGGRCYDMTNHTYDMSENLLNDGTMDFDFLMALIIEDCPIVAQQLIRESAINKYLVDLEAEALKIQKSDSRILRFTAFTERQHYRNSKFNVYQHSKVQAVLGGMMSENSGYGGDSINALGGSENN
jgi:hypothetical protein